MNISIPMVAMLGLFLALMGFEKTAATRDAWAPHQNATPFLSAGQTADALTSAAEGLMQERDLTAAALISAQPISPEMTATLATLRQANDQKLGLGLHQAESVAALSEMRAGRTAIAELDQAVATLAILRHRADAALGQQAVYRDPSMTRECIASITNSLFASERLKAALERVATPVFAGPV